MKLHILLTTMALLFLVSPVVAKDDITKELLTSGGKTRVYSLCSFFNQTWNNGAFDCNAARLKSNWRQPG